MSKHEVFAPYHQHMKSLRSQEEKLRSFLPECKIAEECLFEFSEMVDKHKLHYSIGVGPYTLQGVLISVSIDKHLQEAVSVVEWLCRRTGKKVSMAEDSEEYRRIVYYIGKDNRLKVIATMWGSDSCKWVDTGEVKAVPVKKLICPDSEETEQVLKEMGL